MPKNSELLKQAMVRQGLTHEDCAVLIGVKRPHVSLILSERRLPSRKLAKLIQVKFPKIKESNW